mmetsp:Transcript_40477/g.66216  ORF Transcript_40477/g.66216 Transcript_40477/m.66216 type:complete len:391 (+) Transcript_40477:47-1219(+)
MMRKKCVPSGGIATFNIQHGFVEAVVRGYRSGMLGDEDYHHLTQCENLEDIKMNLQETDYDQFLANESTVTPALLQSKAIEKLVTEFNFLKAQAAEPLSTFLEYISYEYMIENVMLLLKGTLSGRDINELIEQCHPLGMFKESTMRSIPTFENSHKGYSDLYQTVLIDTPVGPYFAKYLEETSELLADASEVRNVLEEVEMEIIKNSLMKLYLEDFYDFCQRIGGDTATVMGELLRERADKVAVLITLHSFQTSLSDEAMRQDRRRLYPALGQLYPQGTAMLAEASDEQALGQVLENFPQYAEVWAVHQNEAYGNKSIEDAFYERETELLELAFEGQMHYGVFYAYVRLKEQEVRNLVWISECVVQNMREEINKFIPVFSQHAPWRRRRG